MLDVRVALHWPDDVVRADAVLLALHARRSADSVQAWAGAHGSHSLAVVMTGTDLYHDIAVDAQAWRSLELAGALTKRMTQ